MVSAVNDTPPIISQWTFHLGKLGEACFIARHGRSTSMMVSDCPPYGIATPLCTPGADVLDEVGEDCVPSSASLICPQVTTLQIAESRGALDMLFGLRSSSVHGVEVFRRRRRLERSCWAGGCSELVKGCRGLDLRCGGGSQSGCHGRRCSQSQALLRMDRRLSQIRLNHLPKLRLFRKPLCPAAGGLELRQHRRGRRSSRQTRGHAALLGCQGLTVSSNKISLLTVIVNNKNKSKTISKQQKEKTYRGEMLLEPTVPGSDESYMPLMFSLCR
ncbi:unnamed protein product [Polarella glacialis]|uniref:Uncharacterized protein n=1 Tax=Polarella glacialis TaxID=89957 RepID=A0A813D8Z0_POLGL|nr:unnamed protein product [Polarella glacialis]